MYRSGRLTVATFYTVSAAVVALLNDSLLAVTGQSKYTKATSFFLNDKLGAATEC